MTILVFESGEKLTRVKSIRVVSDAHTDRINSIFAWHFLCVVSFIVSTMNCHERRAKRLLKNKLKPDYGMPGEWEK